MDRDIDARENERGKESRGIDAKRHVPEHDSALRTKIDSAVLQHPEFAGFVQNLKVSGIEVIPSIQKSGRLNGLSFVVDGHRYRGSDLGRS